MAAGAAAKASNASRHSTAGRTTPNRIKQADYCGPSKRKMAEQRENKVNKNGKDKDNESNERVSGGGEGDWWRLGMEPEEVEEVGEVRREELG